MSVKVRWVLVALVLVVAGAIAFWPRQDTAPQAAPQTPVKTSLPACTTHPGPGPFDDKLTAVCLADGAGVPVKQAFAGPALVNVWATWCGPCQDELPVLSQYAAQPGAIPVVTLAVDSEQSTAIAMLTDLKVNLPSLFDRDGSVRRALKVPDSLPASYLIDASGEVHFVTDPRLFTSVEAVRKAVGR